MEEDLQFFCKRKYKIFEFKRLFIKLQCMVVYFTLFSKKEKKQIGPIADDTCIKICTRLLKKETLKKFPNAKVVGPMNLKHKFEIMTFEQFIDNNL